MEVLQWNSIILNTFKNNVFSKKVISDHSQEPFVIRYSYTEPQMFHRDETEKTLINSHYKLLPCLNRFLVWHAVYYYCYSNSDNMCSGVPPATQENKIVRQE